MIIVTGRVTARPETVDEVLTASLEHVRRSRLEPGCLLHSVQRDVEDPLVVTFLEHWRDEAALSDHFRVQGSRDFVAQLRLLTADASGDADLRGREDKGLIPSKSA